MTPVRRGKAAVMTRGRCTMDKDIEVRTLPLVAAGRARGGRPTQQDDLICLHDPQQDARLLVLADGMGGDGAGEIASAGVIDVARKLWEQGQWREQPGALFLEALCQEAHAEVRRRGRDLAHGEPHSTLVALLTRGNRACWAHVGDSRLYRFQGRRCLDRTEDHSVAQLKVRRGELAADQMASDPEQHKLLRGLGGPQPPQVEHGGAMLRPGQRFALCSDGIWESLSTQELGRLARRRDQSGALGEGLALALERGGEEGDNVALILARVGWREWLSRRARRLRPDVAAGHRHHGVA
jgi:serine/threonine protein phosphatase PrpC